MNPLLCSILFELSFSKSTKSKIMTLGEYHKTFCTLYNRYGYTRMLMVNVVEGIKRISV